MDMINSTTCNTAPSVLRHKQETVRGAAGEGMPPPQQDVALKCPRYHSTNTRFCYYYCYNNMTQPCYFCKACRHYWMQGGTLNNVPDGDGCKNKKNHSLGSASSSSASSSSSSSKMMAMPTAMTGTMTDYPNVLPTFTSTGGGFELPIPTGMAGMHNQGESYSNGESGVPPSFTTEKR